MTRLLSVLIFFGIIAAALFSLQPGGDHAARKIEGLPWQIALQADGSSEVFGVTLGHSTMGEARSLLGPDMELAIIIGASDDRPGLEMFYNHYVAGLLSGKLVVSADIDPGTLTTQLTRSIKAQYLESGARKFQLHPDDLPDTYQLPVMGITFIPSISLDTATVHKRFGEPASTRQNDGADYLLYPELGLDITLNPEGKDILQYVAPRDFSRLRGRLLELPLKQP